MQEERSTFPEIKPEEYPPIPVTSALDRQRGVFSGLLSQKAELGFAKAVIKFGVAATGRWILDLQDLQMAMKEANALPGQIWAGIRMLSEEGTIEVFSYANRDYVLVPATTAARL